MNIIFKTILTYISRERVASEHAEKGSWRPEEYTRAVQFVPHR